MKKLLYVICMFICLGFISGCTKNPCKGVTCTHGTCTDGTCECEAGYEGSTCGTEIRAKFLGNWNGTVATSTGTASLAINIVPGTSINQVLINNLFFCASTSIPVYGTVSGNAITSLNPITCNGNTVIFSTVNWTVSGNATSFALVLNGTETVTGSASR